MKIHEHSQVAAHKDERAKDDCPGKKTERRCDIHGNPQLERGAHRPPAAWEHPSLRGIKTPLPLRFPDSSRGKSNLAFCRPRQFRYWRQPLEAVIESVMKSRAFAVSLCLAAASGLLSACVTDPGDTRRTAVAAPAVPPVNLAGRWRLVSANGGACGMTFTAAGLEGTIAPEGGCPASFFTSRRWVFQNGALVIQDHRQKPLISMKQNGAGRFEGVLANNEAIWLER
jgi:hypothetical protein